MRYLSRSLTLMGALCLLLAACSDGSDHKPDSGLSFDATGFFRVEQGPQRWWLVSPDGKPFYSVGLNHVSSGGYTDRISGINPYRETIEAKYGDEQTWRDASVDRMLEWGFNTIGAWSDRDENGFDDRVAQTRILGMSSGVDDFFSEELEIRARSQIESRVAGFTEAPWILGWFLDNEMDWGKDWRGFDTKLEDYLKLPEGSPGREMAQRYPDDPEGFLYALANRYFEVTTTVLREADPNHLILGIRASTIATPPQVAAAASQWLDVFSINHYDLPANRIGVYGAFDSTPIDGWLERYHELSGLPLMITEFTYRSHESDVPNTYPPIYYTFDTQAERGDAYRRFAERSYDSDYIVGHHWFEYFDDPPGGRSDGEDSNFGLVNNADEPYTQMVALMADTHQYAPHLPMGMERTFDRRAQAPVTEISEGAIIDDHLVHGIAIANDAPAGRYTFSVADPAPASGEAQVQLLRDGAPVAGAVVEYPTSFLLPPTDSPGKAFEFDFPGYFKFGISGEPGIFRYISTFNLYNTVFNGERALVIVE